MNKEEAIKKLTELKDKNDDLSMELSIFEVMLDKSVNEKATKIRDRVFETSGEISELIELIK